MQPIDEGHEDQVALELLNQQPPIDLQVLEELMGEPRRYRDLRPLLAGRGDYVLTKALQRLQDRGAIHQGIDPDLKTKTYRLSTLGKLVIFRVHEFRPIHSSIDAYLKAQA